MCRCAARSCSCSCFWHPLRLAASSAGRWETGWGAKYIIWGSILGVLPFTLLLPYANLFWTAMLTIPIGLILSSAFPAIVVYAQDLMPGRTGTVAGLFFGLAFGMGSVGAAVLGKLADDIGIDRIYQICAFLPLIGLLAAFLPNVHKTHPAGAAPQPSAG